MTVDQSVHTAAHQSMHLRTTGIKKKKKKSVWLIIPPLNRVCTVIEDVSFSYKSRSGVDKTVKLHSTFIMLSYVWNYYYYYPLTNHTNCILLTIALA